MEIYFDNSATTKISEGAKEKMIEAMESHFGNPSSLHKIGLDAEHIMTESRNTILATLGVQRATRGELIFTSGGTEANNLAILGSVLSKARTGNEKILTTDSEHASVEAPLAYLEKKGFNIIRVPTKNGKLDLNFIKNHTQGVILATFMHVNNETGAVYNIKEAFDIIRQASPSAVLHTDCVQSYMKVKLSKKSLGADLITISAHKINGPKGVGALYVSPEIIKTKRLVPIILGGGQEESFRSGTENVYGISAFGVAAREHFSAFNDEINKMSTVREHIINFLKNVDGVSLNIPDISAPHILSITVKGIRSEITLHDLSAKSIYVSSGSACSSHSKKKSSTALLAFGLSENDADCTIRVSLCPDNTIEEADAFVNALMETVSRRAKK